MVVSDNPFTLDDAQVLTMTPNQAALSLLIMALSRLNKPCSLDIYCDSSYMAAGFDNWLAKWKENEWKTSRNKPIENIVEWQVLAYMIARHEYRLHLGENHSYKKWLIEKLKNVELSRCDSSLRGKEDGK